MSIFFIFPFVLSWSFTWCLRRIALSKNIMDIPNQRSSHLVATPRGGGLAFVLTFFIFLPLVMFQGHLPLHQGLILMSAGIIVSATGFLDDLGLISIRWRLFGHFLAGGLAVFGMGGMPELTILQCTIPSGVILNLFAVVYIVWLLNLYNFMDGIDGIAGIETITVCIGAACLYCLSGVAYLSVVPLLMAASMAGFLYWNMPFARIFMGDAGSGFLGCMLGALSIQGALVNSRFFWSWVILLGVFIVDATVTLLVRAMHGAKLYEAHRTHAYQHASSAFGLHYPVTMSVLVINMVWLFPIAIGVGLGYLDGLIGLMIAYLPLVVLTFVFSAGKEEKSHNS